MAESGLWGSKRPFERPCPYEVPPIGTDRAPPPGAGSFEPFGFHEEIQDGIADAGYRKPRPIQTATIPAVLAGRDVLGLAQTGTGKTAAFALPILQLLSGRPRGQPRALIVVPTRELAMQIQTEVRTLAQHTELRCVTLFGGVKVAPQVRVLQNKPDILVACPGRLLDLLGTGDLELEGVEVLVLDEADHMLDMGFLPDIRRILEHLPSQRQNLFFSATMPDEIRVLADDVLRDPLVAQARHDAPVETIEHAVYPVDQRSKSALLQHLLKGRGFHSVLVFVRTKQRAKELSGELARAGCTAAALQGDMHQSQRQRAMAGFRDGAFRVLVATDIAARGLDVEGVTHVINYDLPGSAEAYTHRTGRTGRSARRGKAFTFVTHEDFPALKAMERALGLSIRRIKLREFRQRGSSGAGSGGRAGNTGQRGRRGSGGGSRGGRSGTSPGASRGSGRSRRSGGPGGRGRGGTGRR